MSASKANKNRRGQPTEMSAERMADITRLEDGWLQDRVHGDLHSSEQLLDEDYRGCTSDGLVQSKADFLASVSSLSRKNAQSEHSDRKIQRIGDVVLSDGTATIHHAGASACFRYLRVFVYRDGHWRLIASQSTRIGPTK